MDLGGGLLAVLVAILSVTTVVGTALTGLAYGTMKMRGEMIDDQEGRISYLEKDRVRKDAKITELQADNDALARVVTGEAHWVALGEMLDGHHREARAHWKHEDELLEKMTALLAALAPASERRSSGRKDSQA